MTPDVREAVDVLGWVDTVLADYKQLSTLDDTWGIQSRDRIAELLAAAEHALFYPGDKEALNPLRHAVAACRPAASATEERS